MTTAIAPVPQPAASTDRPTPLRAPTEHALVCRLADQFGADWITPDTLAAFTVRGGDQVLFFSGDPVRFPEGLDVAVVLPELQKAFPGRFSVGVVRREGEDEVARRYGAQRWPSLVFLRDGQYVATVAGMLDWTDYVEQVGRALATPASRPPIALVSGHGAASGCH
ncbi:hydrogenase [Ideonella livida]|uniref:Hydrogenase n=1 Tax=Ideonella livida TaxID=2707176 RepID=A0A7C9PEP4_9BURK|nr:hydrogenase [Ideonella livida]NDY89809.1 hydrogenase [Ideonella livida]